MVWVYKYDEEFVWQPGEELLVDLENGEEVPESYTSIQPQNGLYIAKFDPEKEEWHEAATQEYIDDLQPEFKPSEIEVLRQQHAELVFTLMMGGVI
ncbi:hypothetical protein IHP72_15630 [Bacillus pumilus]|uniref:hypothetical protein n=1 Tax=Bacillus pumilus TaxID=1408 RepID=UPI001B39D3CC|nr:hypothetical protein [Bacillus pumilus]MBQ4817685.1 hypothetical protein [Bacillus pumilus]